jgi:excisionase family DNA binding protein
MNDAPPAQRTPLLTQRQVAEFMHVDVRTVRRWVASGRLKQVTPAGSRIARYRLRDVEALFGEPAE